MAILVAKVAAHLEKERDAQRCAVLQELALSLLQLDIARWQLARLRAHTCLLDERAKDGEDDERDGAAA